MRIPVPEQRLSADQLGRVHFVGIGGAGLSGIARIMLARGITVTGTDAVDSPTLTALRALGATCVAGHDPALVRAADTVVVSTAVAESDPEVAEARRLGLRLLPRSAALDSVMHAHRVLAVAGTHGKTTTTSLLAEALIACDADPSYAIGGELTASGVNAHQGSGELFVAEADESDGAFLVYSPFAAVITNVEADHLDNYGTVEAYAEAFEQFLDRIDDDGFCVCCVDDPGADRLADEATSRGLATVTVGRRDDADLRITDLDVSGGGSRFEVTWNGSPLGPVTLRIPGEHYVLDAGCALAAGLRLGFDFGCLRDGLQRFAGTRRRMELKGEAAGVRVYDSYAHHPTEIARDIEAARSLVGAGRLVVCFQPHLFSRTRQFAVEMGAALGAADSVVLMDVYPAREQPLPGVDGRLVADRVPLPADDVRFEPDPAQVPVRLAQLAGPGDLVLTLGAGDVTRIGPLVLDELRRRA